MPRPIAGNSLANPVSIVQKPAIRSITTLSGLLNAFHRRWVLGSFLGVVAATAAGIGVWLVVPCGKDEVRAVVELPSRKMASGGENPADHREYRHEQVYLLKSRDIIHRTIAEPAVGTLDMVKQSHDPVQMLEEGLKVTAVSDNIIEVSLTGNNLEEMQVILDRLVQRYVDDAITRDRNARRDQIKKLEQLAGQLRGEIGDGEARIELLSRANRTLGAAVKPGFAGDRSRSPTEDRDLSPPRRGFTAAPSEAAVKPGFAGDRSRSPTEDRNLSPPRRGFTAAPSEAAVKPGFAGDRSRSPAEAAVKPGFAGDRSRSPVDGEDHAAGLALLQVRLNDADREYSRVGRELARLEAEARLAKEHSSDRNTTTQPDSLLVQEVIKNDPRVIKTQRAWELENSLLQKELKIAGGNEVQPYIIELKARVAKLQEGV